MGNSYKFQSNIELTSSKITKSCCTTKLHNLQDHIVGQLRGPEQLQNPPVGRHLLGALDVAVGEEIRVVFLLRIAQR